MLFRSEELLAAGLKPGSKRAYYIVPVDFAGHLGDTSATIVQVPDRLRPPIPWNIAFNQRGGELPGATIDWDESTLINYTANFAHSRVICNEEEAAITHRVEYAVDLESCSNPQYTRLDIADYMVYRFATAQQASGFVDADGDGYSDKDEKAEQTDECNIEAPHPTSGVSNYLISQSSFDTV